MLTTTKQGKVQVLLSYTKDHRKHMKEEREIACQGLADLVRDAIKNANGKVTKVTPLGKGFADLMIEANITDPDKLQSLNTYLKQINRDVGAEKVYIFAA